MRGRPRSPTLTVVHRRLRLVIARQLHAAGDPITPLTLAWS